MAYSKEALATAVLRKMGIVAAGNSPSPADSQFVKETYDQKLEEWRDRGLIYWSNTGDAVAEIPAPVFQPLVALIENCVWPAFGRRSAPEDQAAREELLLKALRRHVARPSTGLPLRVDYF